MITVQGKHGIYATVLKHSISAAGINLITLEVSYPRIILAELNTHRMLCKNSSSSRAIPFNKMQEQLTGRPVRFGQANPGMQDKGEDFRAPVQCLPGHDAFYNVEDAWEDAKADAMWRSQSIHEAGYHKQVYNRLTEPFQMMKTVISWTEGANFFWLRKHEAADPSLQELARVMYEAASQSVPLLLHPGEWHLPYVDLFRDDSGEAMYRISDDMAEPGTSYGFVDLKTAISVSCARTAAVSFRNVDYGVEKSEEVFARLVGDERIHGSATEHQATPMQAAKHSWNNGAILNSCYFPDTWEPGVSHMTRDGRLWSGPISGWIQHRKLIPGENKGGFL